MKPLSKKIIETTAELLNRHLADATTSTLGAVLSSNDADAACHLGFINELLGEIAEGGSIVCAVETGGQLLGYVPRSTVLIPELPPGEVQPASSPEEDVKK